ncbi:MAG TPA: thiamine-phosphate kinase, partial [Chthoniobacterales bacterium]
GMKISELGEDGLIARLTATLAGSGDVIAGPGDDCAVIRGAKGEPYWLLKTDSVVEDIHFRRTQPPGKVGWKALCRAISDIGAMGGEPRFALISLASPGEVAVEYWQKFYRGLARAARRYGVCVVGGETSRSPGPIVVTVSLAGRVRKDRLVLRRGGKPGDWLFVTGRLGGSLRGRHLTFEPRVREAAWLARHFRPSAMMDLSDGIAKDLPRLAAQSRVGFSIDPEAIPRNRGCGVAEALGDGEDYELLFAIPPERAEALPRAWRKKFPRLPLTRIGELCRRSSLPSFAGQGFDHFRVD